MSTKTKRKFLLLTEKGMQLTLGLPKYGLTLVIFGICNSTVLHIGLDIYYLAFVCYLHLQFFNHHRYRADGILIPVLRQALSVSGNINDTPANINSKEGLFNEIYTDWINMTLYAPDKVIFSLKAFLENSNNENFNEKRSLRHQDWL